jgi:GNAT superfamily N-acetyltransferase
MEHTALPPDPSRAAEESASVRKLREPDRARAVERIARAFYDDPAMSWIFPDGSRRLDQLERGFALFGRRIWFGHDEAYTTDSVVGGAVWLPPGAWHLGPLKQIAMFPAMVRIAGRDLLRLLRAISLIVSEHPHESHYYLPVIGVAPEWQGKGIGTAMLKPVLDRCDREGLPAYLEASSPRNRACYERSGFVIRDELHLPGGGPPIWPMWRDPRPA